MKIPGAKVFGELLYAAESHKPISCTTTNQNDGAECSATIGPNSVPGNIQDKK
jgi:hypothetical protein